MHFAALTYTPNAPSPLVGTVDEVLDDGTALYTGATVPFDDLAKPERGYAERLAARAIAAWIGGDVAGGSWSIACGPAGPLSLVHASSPDEAPRAFSTLPPEAQDEVRRALEALIELVAGIVRIDGGVGPAKKQRRAELGD